MSPLFLAQQTLWGALAAAAFGVLFNVGLRQLPWCAVYGALALCVRTSITELGQPLEAASFVAALATGLLVQWQRTARPFQTQNAFDVVGCIPLVPGSFAAKAIMGMYAITIEHEAADAETVFAAVRYTLRVVFTLGAIGTGLAIPGLLRRVRQRG